MRWVERAVSGETDLLIASDYDGTLADITERPDTVALPEVARAPLEALARGVRTHVAILSGRPLSDLAPRLGGIGPAWIASDHGSFVVDPQRRTHVLGQAAAPRRHAALQAHAEGLARVFPGTRVEVKPGSVALHFRAAPDASHATIQERFAAACAETHARVLHGRKVVEGLLGGGDKGAALRFIASRLPERTAVIYVGDDTTDEPALHYAHHEALGLALYVRSIERENPRGEVDGYLSGPHEWHDLLVALAKLRGVGLEGQFAS